MIPSAETVFPPIIHNGKEKKMKSSLRPEHFDNGRNFKKEDFDAYLRASEELSKSAGIKYLACVLGGVIISFFFSKGIGGFAGNILAIVCIFGGMIAGMFSNLSVGRQLKVYTDRLGISNADVAKARKHLKQGTTAWTAEPVTFAKNPAAPAQRPAAPAPTAQFSAPGVLLVRFSIEKLNEKSGVYGYVSGELIGKAVPADLLEGMTISDGDSAATLSGREYVCIVSIASPDSRILKEKIEPLILASEEIRACGAAPLTQICAGTREPLVVDGVVRNGKIVGNGGWCASGFMGAWKAAS